MSFFSLYFEPEQKMLCFPNTEYFSNKLERGIWKKYQYPGMPEKEYEPLNDDPEADQDQYVGRGRANNRRGRGQGQGRGNQGRGNNNYNNYNNYRGNNRWGRY